MWLSAGCYWSSPGRLHNFLDAWDFRRSPDQAADLKSPTAGLSLWNNRAAHTRVCLCVCALVIKRVSPGESLCAAHAGRRFALCPTAFALCTEAQSKYQIRLNKHATWGRERRKKLKVRAGWKCDRCNKESHRDKGEGGGVEVWDKQEMKETEMETELRHWKWARWGMREDTEGKGGWGVSLMSRCGRQMEVLRVQVTFGLMVRSLAPVAGTLTRAAASRNMPAHATCIEEGSSSEYAADTVRSDFVPVFEKSPPTAIIDLNLHPNAWKPNDLLTLNLIKQSVVFRLGKRFKFMDQLHRPFRQGHLCFTLFRGAGIFRWLFCSTREVKMLPSWPGGSRWVTSITSALPFGAANPKDPAHRLDIALLAT